MQEIDAPRHDECRMMYYGNAVDEVLEVAVLFRDSCEKIAARNDECLKATTWMFRFSL